MTVLIAASVSPTGVTGDSARVLHRAGLLARNGGGILVAPTSPGGPLLLPGLRHLDAGIAQGADEEHREVALADRVALALEAHRPRIVHALGIRAALPALFRARRGVSVVLEPGRTPAQRLRDAQPDLPAARLEDLVEIEDKALSHAAAVIARSPIEAANLARRGVDSARLHTVPDGLPTPTADTDAPDLPHLVAIVGHGPDKAAATILEALVRVKVPWRLTLVGPGGWSLGAVRQRARSLGIDGRVNGARLDEAALRVSSAQIVLCAIPAGRAVRAGALVPEAPRWSISGLRPLIAPDLPVTRSVAGGAARYFTPDDPGALADMIGALLVEPLTRSALVEQARARRSATTWDAADAIIADTWRALA